MTSSLSFASNVEAAMAQSSLMSCPATLVFTSSVPACPGIMTTVLSLAVVGDENHGQPSVLTSSVPACPCIMTPALSLAVVGDENPGQPSFLTSSVPACSGIMTPLSLGQSSGVVEPAFSCSSTTTLAPACSLDLDTSLAKPALPLLKTATLKNSFFNFKHMGVEKFFLDKKLPSSASLFIQDKRFGSDYFVTLSLLTATAGPTWSADIPNFRSARVKLAHTDLKIDCWRQYLLGYEGRELCQFMEYGFPIGLDDPPPKLEPALSNHGSAYSFYLWIDKFLASSIHKRYVAGPFEIQPFSTVHLSPLMTADKKPSSRRPVFDASYGDHSLNKGTPAGQYLGERIDFTYPKIEDFRRLVIIAGRSSLMWKRDLSSFFLQVPMDPTDYPKVSFVWRGRLFFFTGLMFGLCNAGYNAQKVSDAVTWIHQGLGLETAAEKHYNTLNYSDDFGGVESTLERAMESSLALSKLLVDLGLLESHDKYHPPSTSMPYLGVQFNSESFTMSVPPDKVSEVSEELNLWLKKTTATKKTLQQLLGKLFWVSRCVKYSRPFMGRLLQQLKSIHQLSDNKREKLSSECKLDIRWWHRFMRRFNGVELMYVDEPIDLSLEQLLETGALVNCGDAQVWGGGAYFGDEYWSRSFPTWLRSSEIGIHLKEFYVLLVSCWLWGDQWFGQRVYLFCDNDAVIESLDKQKPKDPMMQDLLREFLFIVCTRKFTPIFRKIGTKQNFVADFISRCHDKISTADFFVKNNLPARKLVHIPDNLFNLRSNW